MKAKNANVRPGLIKIEILEPYIVRARNKVKLLIATVQEIKKNCSRFIYQKKFCPIY